MQLSRQHPTSVPGTGPLLSVEGLSVFFQQHGQETQVLNRVSFALACGERVGIVGESGSGKSLTALSIMGLLSPRNSRVQGRIVFQGQDLLGLRRAQLRQLRGARIGMIFQEPMSALDPVFTIGAQIGETLRAHRRMGKAEARERSIELLASVGIPLPARRHDEYPYQLSGGLRQRAMIAMALSCEPSLLIADEPTTALDVTIQAQIIDLLVDLSESHGTALLFITHDLGVVAQTCTRVLTMYAGEMVEDAQVDRLLEHPRHPYSSGLIRSLPRLTPRRSPFVSIPGQVPAPGQIAQGCRFLDRCGHARDACRQDQSMVAAGDDQYARCCRTTELTLPGATA